jgi:hypothetical protein
VIPNNEDDGTKSLASDPQRKSEMISSIRSRLNTDTQGQDQLARLIWLLAHLEDYLDRWTSCIRFFSIDDYLRNDLHVVLTIGIDIVDEEQRALLGCDAFCAKWQEFAASIRKIDNETNKDIIAGVVNRKFEAVRNELLRIAKVALGGPLSDLVYGTNRGRKLKVKRGHKGSNSLGG